jgi:drug/metabolite transporter (DMT)-like permease
MTEHGRKKYFWKSIILNNKLFSFVVVLLSLASISFFLIPFLVKSSHATEVPPLSYISIVFFFLCFWLLNKKTKIK